MVFSELNKDKISRWQNKVRENKVEERIKCVGLDALFLTEKNNSSSLGQSKMKYDSNN